MVDGIADSFFVHGKVSTKTGQLQLQLQLHSGSKTDEDAVENYLTRSDFAPKTRSATHACLWNLQIWMAENGITSISNLAEHHGIQYQLDLQAGRCAAFSMPVPSIVGGRIVRPGVGNTTVDLAVTLVRIFMQVLVQEGYLPSNPFASLKSFAKLPRETRVPLARPSHFGADHLTELLKAVRCKDQGMHEQAVAEQIRWIACLVIRGGLTYTQIASASMEDIVPEWAGQDLIGGRGTGSLTGVNINKDLVEDFARYRRSLRRSAGYANFSELPGQPGDIFGLPIVSRVLKPPLRLSAYVMGVRLSRLATETANRLKSAGRIDWARDFDRLLVSRTRGDTSAAADHETAVRAELSRMHRDMPLGPVYLGDPVTGRSG